MVEIESAVFGVGGHMVKAVVDCIAQFQLLGFSCILSEECVSF